MSLQALSTSRCFSVGPRKIRESNKCLSTKSLGVKRINQYVVLKTLGHGASSTVHQCMLPADNDIDDAFYAMKIIKRAKISSSMAELEALKKL